MRGTGGICLDAGLALARVGVTRARAEFFIYKHILQGLIFPAAPTGQHAMQIEQSCLGDTFSYNSLVRRIIRPNQRA